MAVLLTLAGGMFGFASALISVVMFEVSVLQAFGIWTGIGLVATGLGLALALAPRAKSVQGQPSAS